MAGDASRRRRSSVGETHWRTRSIRGCHRRAGDRGSAPSVRDHARLRDARRIFTRAGRAARGDGARSGEVRRSKLFGHDARGSHRGGVSRPRPRGGPRRQWARARAPGGGLRGVVARFHFGASNHGFDGRRALGRSALSCYRAVRYDWRSGASVHRRQHVAGMAPGVGRGTRASGGLARSSSDQHERPKGALARVQRRVDVWRTTARRHARRLESPVRSP